MQKSYNEQGQSLVEIALVLPVLLILFLGIAEVGFFLFAHVQVANAVREGARHGTLCRLDETCDQLTTEVEKAVFNEARTLLNATNTTVNVEKISFDVGMPITVTVTYDHAAPFISNFVPMFPATIPIEHTIVMRFHRS
jgi:Flp pilus assembly protein TadG